MFGNYYLRQWNEAAERAEIKHRQERARLEKEAREFADGVFGQAAQESLKAHPQYGSKAWVTVVRFDSSDQPRYLSKSGFSEDARNAIAFQTAEQAVTALDAAFDGKRGNPCIGALKRPECIKRVQAFSLQPTA